MKYPDHINVDFINTFDDFTISICFATFVQTHTDYNMIMVIVLMLIYSSCCISLEQMSLIIYEQGEDQPTVNGNEEDHGNSST